ncbi:DUF2690 domain-containing protein [Streptomyces sp. B1866]|uniref:DUF2690 domain-containing protein n=1 Tax=Streptomyces sp. B1866 TaxID=3075431 RepID=UPI00288F510A|nr:DUF2690 domain-containing protein [Streptomyces sp. B1866]MDT3397142.1 DUF2690 domain-containing protein [Streptomyces sp. B1866]
MAVVGGLIPVFVGGGGDDAQSASAADPGSRECRGASCEGKSPEGYGCGGDGKVIREKAEPVRLQIKYSAACKAAWAKITEADVGDMVTVSRGAGKTRRGVIHNDHDQFTPMVAAEGEFALKACAQANDAKGEPAWEQFCITASADDIR